MADRFAFASGGWDFRGWRSSRCSGLVVVLALVALARLAALGGGLGRSAPERCAGFEAAVGDAVAACRPSEVAFVGRRRRLRPPGAIAGSSGAVAVQRGGGRPSNRPGRRARAGCRRRRGAVFRRLHPAEPGTRSPLAEQQLPRRLRQRRPRRHVATPASSDGGAAGRRLPRSSGRCWTELRRGRIRDHDHVDARSGSDRLGRSRGRDRAPACSSADGERRANSQLEGDAARRRQTSAPTCQLRRRLRRQSSGRAGRRRRSARRNLPGCRCRQRGPPQPMPEPPRPEPMRAMVLERQREPLRPAGAARARGRAPGRC